jgi:ABC-type antimicrobial peptide transport system permease subunit
MKNNPPKWPLRFLRWFCREDFIEEIEGDIAEIFLRQYDHSPAKARRQFTYNVIKHFRPEFIKPVRVSVQSNFSAMIKNYYLTAFRNLTRNRSYAFINIAGLALGLAVCMMIFIIIQFHSSFDNFHKNKANIYRVLTEYHHGDSKFTGKGVPFGIPNGMKAAFPQLREIAPFFATQNNQVVVLNSNNETDKKFKEKNGLFYTTAALFRIVDLPLLAGSSESLDEPGNVLLSKEVAEKYFTRWNEAIGRTIKINNTDLVKVTGVLSTIPANSDFPIGLAVSYGTGFTKRFLQSTNYDGNDGDFGCYILLPENVSAAAFDRQLRAYSKKVKAPDNKDEQTIQALAGVHYDTQSGTFAEKSISKKMVGILWLIAGFILLIACVNFINLSTAQAVNRAREVGVRKVLGSNKWQLQLQFITETFMIVLSAILLATVICRLALPAVGRILDLPLRMNTANALPILSFLGVTCVLVTLLAGFYPSLVLASFNPINALKSKLTAKSAKGISLRRGLVVFQFIIAQTLIIGTLIIVQQMSFFNNHPLGFDKDAIVNVPVPTDSINNTKLDYLKRELKAINGVQAVSFESYTPIEDNRDNWSMPTFNQALKQVDFWSIIKTADNDYVPVYKLPLLAGRNMLPSDTMKEYLVNEQFMHNLHINDPKDILGKELKFSENTKGPIVGVLKDFQTRSFRAGLAPLIISTLRENYSEASVKLSTSNIKTVMASIEKLWNNTYPDFVFEYKFLDEKIGEFYKQENQLAWLYKIFAGIAIFLSCLGLYGLASFMAVQRIKEVGIRKVLGATASNIVFLFSKEFVVLITIAFVIATPLSWYFMHLWLQNFAYKIDLSWWLFLTGGILSVFIALASVGFQAIKTATTNPVKSLRME